MKRLLVASLALALTSCAGMAGAPHIPTAPADIANRTTLDEKGGLAITVAYNAANRLALLAIRTGVAKGATAAKLKELDAKAFALVRDARAAYLVGNATAFDLAERQAKDVIAQITRLAQ